MRVSGALVTILIGNRNYGRFLGEAIDSALSQTYRNCEVIVVDDGSTDHSREVVASYGNRITPILKANQGMASVMNAAFPTSRGEFLLWLDSDDTLAPSGVEAMLEVFRAPGTVQVHGRMSAVDERGAPLGFVFPERPLTTGFLRDATISRGPGIYTSRPAIGAWTRELLADILPMPTQDFAVQADTYLVDHAPLFGGVGAVAEPIGTRRIHGGNLFGASTQDVRLREVLEVFDARIRALSGTLTRLGIDHDPELWKRDGGVYRWLKDTDLALQEVRRLVPPGASFILVDENHWADPLGADHVVQQRTTIPFLERGGRYWGHPPDDETAIAELERTRRTGADAIVFGWPAFWWLDHYSGFHRYLEEHFPRLTANRWIVAYDLQPS